jgi:short-subunit dehydrogenase
MIMEKEKKVAVITGGSSGIGYYTALYLLKRDFNVYVLSRGGVVEAGLNSINCDVTDFARLKEVVDYIVEKEGGIDVFVNNAGFGISGAVEKTPIEDAKKLFELNFFAAFEAIKCVTPYMRAQGGGKIISIGSVAGALHLPFQSFYSASKAALGALSNALRNELKPFKIRLTTILPGDTKTGFTAARKKDFLADDEYYKDRIKKSIGQMEHDESRGVHPDKVAKTIYKAICKKNPKPSYTVGIKYKLFMLADKLLPKRLVQYIIGKIYG